MVFNRAYCDAWQIKCKKKVILYVEKYTLCLHNDVCLICVCFVQITLMNTDIVNKIILLADDDPDDAEMFSMVLSEVDGSVKFYHVDNGLAVLEYLKQIENPLPDVIFLDINMPEMSGWQCLTALKNNDTSKHIPVLIYSTSAHPRDKQIAMDLGASAFITKPSDYKTLGKLLSTVISNLHKDMKVAISGFQ